MTRKTCYSAFNSFSQIFNLQSHFLNKWVTRIENADKVRIKSRDPVGTCNRKNDELKMI